MSRPSERAAALKTPADTLVVPAYLSVVRAGRDLMIGQMPPRAIAVEDAPDWLVGLLGFLSVPRARAEVVDELRRRDERISEPEIEAMLDQLIEAGAITPPVAGAEGRYARHALYFDLIGVDPAEAQRRLGAATVGLIGTGGIGSNLATALVAAGVGTLVFSDDDTVELSNLTRQTLFDEGSVGRLKVEVAAERLGRLDSAAALRPVVSSFYGIDLVHEHFADCDVVVLSADTPPQIHEWISEAALTHGFAYSNAGYIESFGVVGPMVVPGMTACYACMRASADLQGADGEAPENLNPRFQAPSYGPLNSQVAAMQANEVIRRIVGAPVQTMGQRALIDSVTYEVHREDFVRDPRCPACGHLGAPPSADEPTLAQVYAHEREAASQNALVLDGLVSDLVTGTPGRRVLDVGCGSGHDVVRLASGGSSVVGVDVDEEMLAVAQERVDGAGLAAAVRLTHDPLEALEGPFDALLCLNVLDYLEDPRPMLAQLRRLVADHGVVVISVPHPVKDRGGWRKERMSGQWRYVEFVLDDYFEEGPVTKTQEDAQGDALLTRTYFHRTTARWMALLLETGFSIRGVHEPQADAALAAELPILYQKSSRVPYFLVVELSPSGRR